MESFPKGSAALSLHSNSESDGATEWRPRKGEYLVMITVSIISLMVALDATILVPVLPVSYLVFEGSGHVCLMLEDACTITQRNVDGCFLGRHIIPSNKRCLPAFHSSAL